MDKKEMLKQLMRALRETIDEAEGNEKIIRSFKMTPEQMAAYDQLGELDKQIDELQAKKSAKRDVFWASVKEHLNVWTGHLRVNRKDGEINLIEHPEDED